MTTIYDYLDWRGDLPFTTDPFNEVDNTILSLLAYVHYDGIPNIETTFQPLHKVRDEFYKLHTHEEIAEIETYNGVNARLLDKVCDTERFKDIKIGYYISYSDKDFVVQFSAVTFKLDDMIYISYRGTDNTFIGWKEDFYLSYTTGTNGQKAAVAYINQLFAKETLPIHVGGHSKGGNLAIYAACHCKDSIRNHIKKVWSNDGPGFQGEMLQSTAYQAIQDKITLIIPDSSIIGILMNNVEPKIIKSTVNNVQQHDALTWIVKRNHFENAESLSANSVFLNKAVDKFLENLSEDEAKIAIDAIFSILESTDAESFSKLKEGGFDSLKDIISALQKLPPEKSSVILRLIGTMISDSGNILANDYMTKVQEQFNKVKDSFTKKTKGEI
ncbi:MAG: DUF2974 domain-containing protein [Solobacterium sp.]|nr:DUF2974 domain-containing protein [Solobacterium sp.]